MLLQLALMSLLALAGTGDGAKTSTHIRFYMHDIFTGLPGRPATAVRIARGTTPLPDDPRLRFGDMYAIDDLLTEGPDAASPALGRAKGFYIITSETKLDLMLTFNMVFTAGPYNGSTIAVMYRDLTTDKVRELPVVGGTGVFRGVTGYGLHRTQAFNVTNLNAVLKIDMYLRF